jgi:hypothetical protein
MELITVLVSASFHGFAGVSVSRRVYRSAGYAILCP